ncbi:MAG: hypothetical protein EA378_06495 [Phycisphaerales bacterium]|nr:MAG: hypothetical protein EA378_06495 [Phycisphaerales bacterium]
MAWDPQARNNVLTGAFLISALLLAVGVSFILAEVRLERRTAYVFRFPMTVGAPGLDSGSPVTVGGLPAGQVSGVRFERDDQGRPTAVLVDARVRTELTLYDDALVYLERPLVGTLSSVNIAGAGGRTATAARLDAGGTVTGTIAPPAFLAGAGFGESQAMAVGRIVDHLEHFLAESNRIVAAIDLETDPALHDARAALADLRAAAARVRSLMDDRLPAWSTDITGVLTDAREATRRAPGLLDDAGRLVSQGEGLVTDVRGTLQTTRPSIERATNDLAALADSVRASWDEHGSPTLAAARGGAESFEAIARDAQSLLNNEQDALVRILANGRLASDQLKLAAIEIRAAPWRLLTRPDTKELETQLLYDAARSYALAASDLRDATERLRIVATTDTPRAEQAEAAEHGLSETLARFQEAEQRFLQLMIDRR